MQRSTVPSAPPPSESGRASLLRPSGLPGSARANVLVLVVGIGLGFFLAVEPTRPWILLLVTALTALGMSGVVSEQPVTPRGEGQADASKAAFSLIIPVLWVFGAGLLAEYSVGGFWSLLAAAVITLCLGAIVYAEKVSLHPESQSFQTARFTLNVASYVIAFALFAAPYALDLNRSPAALFVGVAAVLMTIELMREAPLSSGALVLIAGTAGLLLMEARWAFYYLPLEKFLSATLLLIMFYVVTGVMQAQLLSRLTRSAAMEYAVFAATGLLLILAAHALF